MQPPLCCTVSPHPPPAAATGKIKALIKTNITSPRDKERSQEKLGQSLLNVTLTKMKGSVAFQLVMQLLTVAANEHQEKLGHGHSHNAFEN
jgi:hypothetical protein